MLQMVSNIPKKMIKNAFDKSVEYDISREYVQCN